MHPSKNKKWIRGNNKPNRKKSRLKNKTNKIKDPTDIRNLKKKRNYVANLDKVANLEYFCKYKSNGNKRFWVNCKHLFTNKHSKADT